jgi:hypothetical protein
MIMFKALLREAVIALLALAALLLVMLAQAAMIGW